MPASSASTHFLRSACRHLLPWAEPGASSPREWRSEGRGPAANRPLSFLTDLLFCLEQRCALLLKQNRRVYGQQGVTWCFQTPEPFPSLLPPHRLVVGGTQGFKSPNCPQGVEAGRLPGPQVPQQQLHPRPPGGLLSLNGESGASPFHLHSLTTSQTTGIRLRAGAQAVAVSEVLPWRRRPRCLHKASAGQPGWEPLPPVGRGAQESAGRCSLEAPPRSGSPAAVLAEEGPACKASHPVLLPPPLSSSSYSAKGFSLKFSWPYPHSHRRH